VVHADEQATTMAVAYAGMATAESQALRRQGAKASDVTSTGFE
jgi:hypothetical protein